MPSETPSSNSDDKPVIHYLNTDLDLVCDADLSPIVECFNTFDLYPHLTEGGDGRWYVMCEDMNDTTPEPNIVKLLDAIEALSDTTRDLWDRCTKREFNIGYDCGDEPWAFNQGLSNDVLRRMADCGATFRITLYPHRPDSVNDDASGD